MSSSSSSSSSSSAIGSIGDVDGIKFSRGSIEFPDGLFDGDAVFDLDLSKRTTDRDRAAYDSVVESNPDGIEAAKQLLTRMFIFKGIKGEVVKGEDITKCVTYLNKATACKNVFMGQIDEKLRDIFGFGLRERYKRKKVGDVKRKGQKKQKKLPTSSSRNDLPELEGTKTFYIVNQLALPPLVGRKVEEDSDSEIEIEPENGPAKLPVSSLKRNDIEKLMKHKSDANVKRRRLCDAHRHALSAQLSDVEHAERALLLVVLALIRNGEKDEQGCYFLNEDALFSQLQDVFSTNIQKDKSRSGSGEDFHQLFGSVRNMIMKTFVSHNYIRRGDDPSVKDKKATAFWIGQRAVHEIGMPALFEFMTKLTGRPLDLADWKTWAEEDVIYA